MRPLPEPERDDEDLPEDDPLLPEYVLELPLPERPADEAFFRPELLFPDWVAIFSSCVDQCDR